MSALTLSLAGSASLGKDGLTRKRKKKRSENWKVKIELQTSRYLFYQNGNIVDSSRTMALDSWKNEQGISGHGSSERGMKTWDDCQRHISMQVMQAMIRNLMGPCLLSPWIHYHRNNFKENLIIFGLVAKSH